MCNVLISPIKLLPEGLKKANGSAKIDAIKFITGLGIDRGFSWCFIKRTHFQLYAFRCVTILNSDIMGRNTKTVNYILPSSLRK